MSRRLRHRRNVDQLGGLPLRFASLVLLLTISACRLAEPTRPATHSEEAIVPSESASKAPVCHPMVSGCGCAYQCAYGLRLTHEGSWEVTHDYQDSRTDETTLERWCFDDTGHGYPVSGAPASAKRCLDVFYDRTVCGGECIPTTSYLGCHAAGAHCAP
jgi:hypothetical protein